MTSRIRESVPKKIALTLGAAVLLVIGLFACDGNARAETGSNPQLDQLCWSSPAWVQGTPVATLNGNKLQNSTIGLRKQNGYCKSGGYIAPPDYGTGPQILP